MKIGIMGRAKGRAKVRVRGKHLTLFGGNNAVLPSGGYYTYLYIVHAL